MPQSPRVGKNTEIRIFYASSAYAGAYFSFQFPPESLSLFRRARIRSVSRGNSCPGSTATPGCVLLPLTLKPREIPCRGKLHSLRRYPLACHSVSDEARFLCPHGLDRGEESGVDPKCLRSGEFFQARPGVQFHRGAISRLFPQTFQPRTYLLLSARFNAASSDFKVSVKPSICFLVRRRSVSFSIDSSSR